MFDIGWSELLVIGVVALIVIKPADLPKVLRTVGYWVRHARSIAAEFQSSLEQMARESEIHEVKKEIEDAGRKFAADVEKSIDPVEVEKAFATPSPPIDTKIELPPIEPPPPPVFDSPADTALGPVAPRPDPAAAPETIAAPTPAPAPSSTPTPVSEPAPQPTGTDRV